MTAPQERIIRTYPEWQAAVRDLVRLVPDTMNGDELDEAGALLYARPDLTSEQSDAVMAGTLVPELRYHLRLSPEFVPAIWVKGKWVDFSVIGDWNAFGSLISSVGLVIGGHESEADGKRTIWHSCHAYFSSTRAEGYEDVRYIVCESAARLLQVRPHA